MKLLCRTHDQLTYQFLQVMKQSWTKCWRVELRHSWVLEKRHRWKKEEVELGRDKVVMGLVESGLALQRVGKMVDLKGNSGSGSGSVKQELPKRTEGEMPPDDGGQSLFGGSVTDENGLQRALEKEMVERLHQENLQLKFEMEQLKRNQAMAEGGTTTTSWSEVSIPEGGVPPPPPRSRSPTRRCLQKQEEKFTPQGTRVPDTPPPSDDATLPAVPPWPWGTDGYEKSEMDGPCQRSWGPSLRGGVRYLSREGRSRQRCDWHDEDWQRRGMNRDAVQGDLRSLDRDAVQGDVLSRHGEPDEVMDAATARAEWLRQELMTLRLQMERDARRSGGKLSSDYWQQPVSRQDQQLGREGRWGVCQQAPLGRASREGDCHQAPQCRADFDGRCARPRAGRSMKKDYQFKLASRQVLRR